MNKTEIEWCDSTWNPVTGCLHGCEYCYARGIAKRFGTRKNAYSEIPDAHLFVRGNVKMPVLDSPVMFMAESPEDGCSGEEIGANPYPAGFTPTFHRYRLDWPQKQKEPRTIFVGSMTDLFGDWAPDEWIKEVFKACEAAPQHRYLFLTKNPQRYCDLANNGKLPQNKNFWYGTTITKRGDLTFPGGIRYNTFLSIEPLLEPLDAGIGSFGSARWVIIGAETGSRKNKVVPRREWIDNIVNDGAVIAKVFMKNSLIPIVGEENMLRQFPWEEPQ